MRIIDAVSQEEVIRYDFEKQFSDETDVIIAQLYRSDADWMFEAMCEGIKGGLSKFLEKYGIHT